IFQGVKYFPVGIQGMRAIGTNANALVGSTGGRRAQESGRADGILLVLEVTITDNRIVRRNRVTRVEQNGVGIVLSRVDSFNAPEIGRVEPRVAHAVVLHRHTVEDLHYL